MGFVPTSYVQTLLDGKYRCGEEVILLCLVHGRPHGEIGDDVITSRGGRLIPLESVSRSCELSSVHRMIETVEIANTQVPA